MSENDLSEIEEELLELIELGQTTTKTLERINPRYLGALSALKKKGIIVIEKIPNYKLYGKAVYLRRGYDER